MNLSLPLPSLKCERSFSSFINTGFRIQATEAFRSWNRAHCQGDDPGAT